MTTCIRAAFTGAAVVAGLLGRASVAPGSPRALPAPRVSFDELGAQFRTLATAGDVTTIGAALGTVIAGLETQAVLVPGDYEPTYVWLLGKLRGLRDACAERRDTGTIVRSVNALATELADALHS
ncbi:hypothetical protein [Amycolatopsis pigmentata]|uniref:Uncharacterized protein n=1 Tax=Amycolatopsis pigmentata TaxID=450801 RepID=A0ABW5FQQ4_9PSEU